MTLEFECCLECGAKVGLDTPPGSPLLPSIDCTCGRILTLKSATGEIGGEDDIDPNVTWKISSVWDEPTRPIAQPIPLI